MIVSVMVLRSIFPAGKIAFKLFIIPPSRRGVELSHSLRSPQKIEKKFKKEYIYSYIFLNKFSVIENFLKRDDLSMNIIYY